MSSKRTSSCLLVFPLRYLNAPFQKGPLVSKDLLKEASVYKEKLKGVFTINRKIANTAIGRDVVDALKEFELSVLDSHISQRVIFAEAAASGKTVFDIEPDGKAANEIIALVDEILKFGDK